MTFSVIVPMYNVEQYAPECIDSILNQSFTDFELILVDDGSTDRTSTIIEEYQKQDSRIKVVHKANGGLTSARKAGAQLATGEYVAIVDGDDSIEKDYLQSFYAVINKHSPDLVIDGYVKEQKSGKEYAHVRFPKGMYNREKIDNIIMPNLFFVFPTVWAKAFKRSLYLEAQFKVDDFISLGEDGCMTYPIISKCSNLYIMDKCLYNYRFNPISLTKSRKKKIPWDNILWRIAHFEKELPINDFGIKEQLAAFVSHSCFNAAIGEFRNAKYKKARRIIAKELEKKTIKKQFSYARVNGSIKEKIAYFALKYRLFVLIKLYSLM